MRLTIPSLHARSEHSVRRMPLLSTFEFVPSLCFVCFLVDLHIVSRLQNSHSAFLLDSSIIKVETSRSWEVQQTVHHTQRNELHSQAGCQAVGVARQMPLRLAWRGLGVCSMDTEHLHAALYPCPLKTQRGQHSPKAEDSSCIFTVAEAFVRMHSPQLF